MEIRPPFDLMMFVPAKWIEPTPLLSESDQRTISDPLDDKSAPAET